MDIIIQTIVIFYWLLLIILGGKLAMFLILSWIHYKKTVKTINHSHTSPLVSIIVPAFNEELTLDNCISSLLTQTYTHIEIIIIDDGSTDGTLIKAYGLLKKAGGKLKIFTKENAGKAMALNYGLYRANGEIVVTIDADSIFLPNTVEELVSSFSDPKVVAVGGNVKVANRNNLLGKFQAAEYISSLNIQRRAFAFLNCIQVLSGPIAAFRKKELIEVGGYSNDTLVEDMDITITLAKIGHKINYNSRAIAYTEAPETIENLLTQRYRWTFGSYQVAKKHIDLFFNSNYKTLGYIGLPFFFIFPWIDVFLTVITLSYLTVSLIYGDFLNLAFYFLISSVFGVLMLFFSLFMDKDDKSLVLTALADWLFYKHILSYTTVKAGVNFIFGKKNSWGQIQRLGKNISPLS